ncbi:MAG: hypothetical protein JWQ39_2064 [Glaciihabitans sp.]|nr:hypothetical protein [Glaciihabitans sp.]
MRVLFTTLPLVGHLFPAVSLAWSLRTGGDEVLVATTSEPFADTITGAGLPAIVIHDIPVAEYAHASVCTSFGDSLPADLEASGRGWGALAARTVSAMEDLIRAFEPDLVISEPAEFAGRLAATRCGVRWVELGWGVPFAPAFRRGAEAELCRRGHPRLPAPDLVIHPSPRQLWPAGTPDGIAMRFVPYNGPVRLSRWQRREPGKPRAFVTFGSLLLKHGAAEKSELFRKILEELSSTGVEMIVGMDPAQAAQLTPFPPGVQHVGWIPIAQAISGCDLVVHHGGSGTSMSAASSGVPQVILPNATDQFVTAAALESYGAAICLTPDTATPTSVREAATELLANPSYGAAARALAAEISALATPSAVAERLRAPT